MTLNDRSGETGRQLTVNPIVPGWYADPEARIFEGKYWIYPTYSAVYDDQTFFDAFYSEDRIHWTKVENVLDISRIPWAKRALWAPSPIEIGGKYFLYFSANDIQSDNEHGGIGVAVSSKPEGPFIDAIGKPLINRFHNGAQPIDPHVFLDDDGTVYLYYGGWGHCNVVKLNKNMVSLDQFEDGSTYKEITPDQYVEGPCMLKRLGLYYFMWAEGGWEGPDYSVAYACSHSPLGPFKRIGKVLQQDPNIATGAGHHGVFQISDKDEWYIAYHRRPLTEVGRNSRVLCIDRMFFSEDGKILPVKMT